MGLAEYVATASKDPSTKVGAVIVDDRRIVLGMGYNGFPRRVRDDVDRYNDRPTKYAMVVHAEANAILNAAASVRGATLYCTWHPCSACAALIIQAGIVKVVSPPADPRWVESATIARTMFEEAEIKLVSPT
jgi:dCMP deaminase